MRKQLAPLVNQYPWIVVLIPSVSGGLVAFLFADKLGTFGLAAIPALFLLMAVVGTAEVLKQGNGHRNLRPGEAMTVFSAASPIFMILVFWEPIFTRDPKPLEITDGVQFALAVAIVVSFASQFNSVAEIVSRMPFKKN